MNASIRKADILVEAVPYLQAFRHKVIVAKYGGSAIDNPSAMRRILEDLVFLSTVGIRAVLVHGGGPAITRKLALAGYGTSFIDGMRVTDSRAVKVVSRALEDVNRCLVHQIEALGGQATGIVPRGRVLQSSPHPKAHQLGSVGAVRAVQTSRIRQIFTRHAIPVISPVGMAGRRLYNMNADHVASEVAVRLHAEKLVLLTNVRGILRRPQVVGSLMSTLSVKEARGLLQRGVIQTGMIPKVQACMAALRSGVKKTHIIDASIPHAMLLEIFTKKGIGTEIVR